MFESLFRQIVCGKRIILTISLRKFDTLLEKGANNEWKHKILGYYLVQLGSDLRLKY